MGGSANNTNVPCRGLSTVAEGGPDRLSPGALAGRTVLVAGGAGAVGNAIDRIVYGAVADFFSFHAFGFEWYVFNIADIAIVWATFLIWVVGDARKISLGARKGWLFFGLSFLGTCFALPLYLVARERHLARVGGTA